MATQPFLVLDDMFVVMQDGTCNLETSLSHIGSDFLDFESISSLGRVENIGLFVILGWQSPDMYDPTRLSASVSLLSCKDSRRRAVSRGSA